MMHTDRDSNFMISFENGYSNNWVTADNQQINIDGKDVAYVTLSNKEMGFALTVNFKDNSSIMMFDNSPLTHGIKNKNLFADVTAIFNHYIKKFVNYVN